MRRHVDRARSAYMEAFNTEYTDVLDRNVLQMKIDDLPVAAVADSLPALDAEAATDETAAEEGA